MNNEQQRKVYYSSRRKGVRVRKCSFCAAGQYVGHWFVGSVCEASSSERRVPSGSHVRKMCLCCWFMALCPCPFYQKGLENSF